MNRRGLDCTRGSFSLCEIPKRDVRGPAVARPLAHSLPEESSHHTASGQNAIRFEVSRPQNLHDISYQPMLTQRGLACRKHVVPLADTSDITL